MTAPKLLLLLAALAHLSLAQTTVTLATSSNPSIFGAPVVLTAIVAPSNASGRVTFYDGVAVLGTASLPRERPRFPQRCCPRGSAG